MRLIDLVSKYIRLLKREQSHALRTIVSYESDLRLFAKFTGESRRIQTISEHHIAKYFRYLTTRQRASNATISRKICALRGFFRYMEDENYVVRSPIYRLQLKARIERKTPIYISPDECNSLFQVINDEHRALELRLIKRRDRGDKDRLTEYQLLCNVRNNLLFRLTLETGIRTSDLAMLLHDQVKIFKNSGKLYSDIRSDQFRTITESETVHLLKTYRNIVKQADYQSNYFFFNRYMNRLSTVMIQKIFKHYVNLSPIKRHLTPSSLRHAFAVNLIRQSVDMNTIRSKLGLKTFEGLSIYKDFFSDSTSTKQNSSNRIK